MIDSDDLFQDSIDDIISVLNAQKAKSNVNTKNIIEDALDQCRQSELSDLNTILNPSQPIKKPLQKLSHQRNQFRQKEVDVLNNRISNMYINPPKNAKGGVQLPTVKRKTSISSTTASSIGSEHKENITAKMKDENNLTYHPKASGQSSLIRFMRFLPLVKDMKKKPELPNDNGYYFKVGGDIKIIKYLFYENGFLDTNHAYDWSIYWSVGPIKNEVNHFPKSSEITRKDSLHRNISKMQISYGAKNFDFVPKSFILSAEASLLQQDNQKNKGEWYIVKPQASSQGRGIFITDKLNDIFSRTNQQLIVSHYINDPYLINGLKFDLRIYVAVTSIHPLRIYMFEEGLVRFATDQYTKDPTSKANKYVHLTNYSINKHSENYVANNDDLSDDESSSKWSIQAFKLYLQQQNIDPKPIFAKIEDALIKTILSMESTVFSATTMQVSYRNNCFELFGFDILLDQKLKPWVLEVNLSPSLACESPLDLKIKGDMMCDLFTMVGVTPLDQRNYYESQQQAKCFNLYSHSLNVPNFDKKTTTSDIKPLGDLTKEERTIIKETNEEYERRGKFKRIYPSSTVNDYIKFFENDRPYNKLLRQVINENLRKINEQKVDMMKNFKFNSRLSTNQNNVSHISTSSNAPLYKPIIQKKAMSMNKYSNGYY